MKVTQEKLPASQVGLEIEISPEMSKKAYEQVIQNLARSANIPGFRKGKVPRQILLQRFGTTRLKAAALEDTIRDSVKEAIEQEDIQALGNYQLRSDFEELVERFEPGKPLTFSATVDVSPAIKLEGYERLQVKVEEVKYDPSSVDKFLEERRKQQATLVPVAGRPAQMGDVAVVDFSGRLVAEGEAEAREIPGGQAEDFQIELAEGRFIQGFVDGIVGMEAGETKEISVRFPADYPQAELADEAAIFTVTLKELKEKDLPEVDDDFAQEVSEFETLAELRTSLESRFQETAQNKTRENKKQALLLKLGEEVEADLPETMIEQEVDSLLTQTAMRLNEQGIDVKQLFNREMIPELRTRTRPEAIDRIKRSLALKEVAKRESISVEPEAVEAKVKELMQQYKERDIDLEKLREFVEEDLVKEKIIEWLEERATIELVPEGSLSENIEAEILEPESETISSETQSPVEALIEPEPTAIE